MYNKILVPFDNSETARHALEEALEMTKNAPEANITILKVVEWQDYNAETFKIASRMSGVLGDAMDMSAIAKIDNATEDAEIAKINEEIADIANDAPNLDIVVVNGSPHDTIVDYANDYNYDAIVMGHRGMGMIRGMLGSVCYSVLQKSTIPVLVVK